MDEQDRAARADELAARFEAHRGTLRGVAYRLLGSLAEADDAVQEAWFRLSRSETGDITSLEAWLRTTVSRICLDMLRTRAVRREEPLDDRLPAAAPGGGPQQEHAHPADSGRDSRRVPPLETTDAPRRRSLPA